MEIGAKYWIDHLNLQQHPEGGYYAETYRSKESVRVKDGRTRNLATSIYFLLDKQDKSHFHVLESDELWYFHTGVGVRIHMLSEGSYRQELLGNNLAKGEQLQLLIPKHTIFAAELIDKTTYCLMGCVVAPGFDFADFELVRREELIKKYPDQAELIDDFT
ncbi:MAG: cupin domain-containing protein [Cyclobacteriaceae bacterium]|nr:cupin domain-containing protein [Cyclobacteriaceae bacterium HetDA_MAG_MS6]